MECAEIIRANFRYDEWRILHAIFIVILISISLLTSLARSDEKLFIAVRLISNILLTATIIYDSILGSISFVGIILFSLLLIPLIIKTISLFGLYVYSKDKIFISEKIMLISYCFLVFAVMAYSFFIFIGQIINILQVIPYSMLVIISIIICSLKHKEKSVVVTD